MASSSEDALTLAKHKYWNELQPDRHHFFKIMVRDFRRQVMIPKKFTMHFQEELSCRILLKGPSGNKWPVELTREEDDVFFQKGWGGFVVDHGLEETDFLVFRYNGSSSFSVLIFDASGCEREGSYFVKNQKEQCSYDDCVTEEAEEDDSVEVICLDEDAKDSWQEKRHKEQRGGKKTNFSMKRKNLKSSMAQNKIYGPNCHKGKPCTNKEEEPDDIVTQRRSQ
ncbi:hypothetical protein RJ640_012174 [Escallonia rubra]|uniref:TF-B3 domain-containing protein n=1 Tax=Escallonia rubra TaxID=112253 RepID=A0AA88UDZ9_9ASTE|nr:hypothetical protein RJ640_012174 [Escallonia rubra]